MKQNGAIFILSAIFLISISLYAADHKIMRVTFYDGTVKDYVVNYISEITFKADPNDVESSSSEETSYSSSSDTNVDNSSSSEETSSSSSNGEDISSSSTINKSSSSSKAISSSSAKVNSSSSSKTNNSSSSQKKDALVELVLNTNPLKIVSTNKSLFISSQKRTSATITILNLQGQCLKTLSVDLHSGLNMFSLDKKSFRHNKYIIRVKTPENDVTTPFTYED